MTDDKGRTARGLDPLRVEERQRSKALRLEIKRLRACLKDLCERVRSTAPLNPQGSFQALGIGIDKGYKRVAEARSRIWARDHC